MDAADDPLAKLNDEIRRQGVSASKSSQWLALESNPDVFNTFCKKIGMPEEWGFVDVLGLDDELLGMVPGPVVACVLLFPCTSNMYRARRRQEASWARGKADDSGATLSSEDLFFIEQVADFGNACGTIACVHAVANSRHWLSFEDGAAIEGFVRKQARASPEERGRALLTEPSLRASSDEAAAAPVAQTACPDRDGPPLDHHFASFVRTRDSRLVELDGTKKGPVDHGPTSAESFLKDAAAAMNSNFVQVDPDVHGFAFMALTRNEEPA